MPGFNPESINIHDLTVEEPEKQAELPFDVERDITPEIWEKMKSSIEKDVEQHGFFAGKAREMKLLFPGRSGELHLDNNTWKGIKSTLDTDIEYGGVPISEFRRWDKIPEWAADLKILFPERFSEVDLSQEIWEGVIKDIKKWTVWMVENKNGAHSIGKQIIDAKIVDPENEELNEISKNVKLRDVMIEYAMMVKEKKKWYEFIPQCAGIKILFPDSVKEILDTETWTQLRSYVKNIDFGKWFSMREYENLKILAAEEVKFTDKGMEFVMPGRKEVLQTETPSMPETRDF